MSQTNLKYSVSGLRGIVSEALTEKTIEQYIYAWLTYAQPRKVILARDTRESGPVIQEQVQKLLMAHGCEVVDVGVVATPTVQFMIRTEKADGGIAITASHNPPEYNGLKFFNETGCYYGPDAVHAIQAFVDGDTKYESQGQNGSCVTVKNASEQHIQHIIDKGGFSDISASNLRVVVDPVAGAGCYADPILMKQLGLSSVVIHGEPGSTFPRGTEPIPAHLEKLGKAVREHGADIGFAQDPDADRLALVDETGKAIGEDYTLAFAVDALLSHLSNPADAVVVTNLSTSRLVDDVAERYGARVIRTKIGEMHVSEAIQNNHAVIGGEGNGGVIWPDVSLGRDSFVGMALISRYIAEKGKKVSELVAELPYYYYRIHDKVEVANREEVAEILDRVRDVYTDQEIDETDGVKVIFEKGWLHVRASNTEPIVRLYAEALSEEEAQGWIDAVK